jgi:hypothetical protein
LEAKYEEMITDLEERAEEYKNIIVIFFLIFRVKRTNKFSYSLKNNKKSKRNSLNKKSSLKGSKSIFLAIKNRII